MTSFKISRSLLIWTEFPAYGQVIETSCYISAHNLIASKGLRES